MIVYLTRQMDNKYTITGMEPVIAKVEGTERYAVYCQPGDPVLIRDQCWEYVHELFGKVEIPILHPAKAEITGRILQNI